MRTITYNDEAALWIRSNYLLGIRLLPSSDSSNDIFSKHLWEHLDEIMVNQNTPVTGTVYLCIPLSPTPKFFCLLKPTTHICTTKMTEDELSVYSASSHTMCPAM
jgi:hypothetical protein